jgi:hypothetical protein
LIELRKNGKSGYQIPRGGFFEYVSAANYFGECLEWFGFFLASWSLPALAFSIFTISNIGPRGYHHHLYVKIIIFISMLIKVLFLFSYGLTLKGFTRRNSAKRIQPTEKQSFRSFCKMR